MIADSLFKIPKIWMNLAAHPLNGSVFSAAWRWTKWQMRSRAQSEVILDWANGLKLKGRHGMISISMQAYNGIHELRDMCFASHLLKEDDIFFDVGANIGVYSLLIAQTAKANAFAFEPVPASADLLEANIDYNRLNSRIKPIRKAISSKTGNVTMSTDDDVMNKIIHEGHESNNLSTIVDASTLDIEAKKHGVPTLIKIDVEGFEPDVIAGAVQTLQNEACKALILEINDNADHLRTTEMLSVLRTAGFVEMDYNQNSRELEPCKDSQSTEGDNCIFVKSAQIPAIAERLARGEAIEIRGRKF